MKSSSRKSIQQRANLNRDQRVFAKWNSPEMGNLESASAVSDRQCKTQDLQITSTEEKICIALSALSGHASHFEPASNATDVSDWSREEQDSQIP
jgi:hypothetical protein